MYARKYIIVLNNKEKHTISNIFTVYILLKYLPKRESTHAKCTELSLKQKEGMVY